MVECLSKAVVRSTALAWKCVKTNNAYQIGRKLLSIANTAAFLQHKRCLYVPPLSVNLGILSLAAYYLTKLGRPDPRSVHGIFGPMPGTLEGKLHASDLLKCIAQRGAGGDAPENSMTAFKYCIDKDCKFVEIDVRSSKDGKLVLLHDEGLDKLAYCNITDVSEVDWEAIQNINIAAKHPNRQKYNSAKLCLLEDALDYLMDKKAKILIDIKGHSQEVIHGILNVFQRPGLYDSVAVSSVNPWIIYKIRTEDPDIVAALKYQPYAFSATKYDVKTGPSQYRYEQNILAHSALRCVDVVHTQLWRRMVRWCGASAVLLHKDIVSPYEIKYWRDHGIRCIGWSVDTPIEKLYWRKVLKTPYIANTLVGEPDLNKPEQPETTSSGTLRPEHIVNSILEEETVKLASTQR